MKKFHIVSHTHWDREWYLTYQQFRLRLVHLVDKLLAILDDDPEFKHFMLDGQTIILDDYLAVRPEKESLIKGYIQQGRILIGPWYILPDMFLVGPEAHIRNLLQGDRTAKKFGPKMCVGYIPDPFGHPGQIPQILLGFGIKSAALWRGLSSEPTELMWESPDGSQVFLANLRDSYSNGANLPTQDADLFTHQLALTGESLLAHSRSDHCLIMLGTDHMEPSAHTSQAIQSADGSLPDAQVLHSTLPAYIEQVNRELADQDEGLPLIHGELRACDHSPLLPGVLSARMWIKQRNQYSESLLQKWAEPFSVFAEAITKASTGDHHNLRVFDSRQIENLAPLIRQAWSYLMKNHPHDSICGCSIDQVHNEMVPRFDQADQIGEELTTQALQRLSNVMETQHPDAFSAIVLFNPHDHPHRDLVEVDLDIPEAVTSIELIDETGAIIPHDTLGSSHEELANVLVNKRGLRETIGGVNEGWVAGMAIIQAKVSKSGDTVRIEAVLDDRGQPDLQQWQEAERRVAEYEADPEIRRFQVIAHTPRSSRIRFVSPEIMSLGWRVIWARALPEKPSGPPQEVSPLLRPLLPLVVKFAQTRLGEKLLSGLGKQRDSKEPIMVENEYFRVEADHTDGTLQVLDKQSLVTFKGLNRLIDGGDAGDTYNFSPPEADAPISARVESIRLNSRAMSPTIDILYLLKVPESLAPNRKQRARNDIPLRIKSRISLLPGVPRIDIRTEVENQARDHRLRVHFPAPFMVEAGCHDGHYEVVQRRVGVLAKADDWVEDPRPEVPQRAFTDISNGEIGLMIAVRGLPEVEVLNPAESAHSEIAVTLLRCVGWLSRGDMPVRQGHAGPAYETPGAQVPGRWSFDYAIIPHEGDWRRAYRKAYGFQTSLRAASTGLHEGILPAAGSFMAHSPKTFVISAIKPAEDSQGWILRGVNLTEHTLKVQFNPLVKCVEVYKTNLAEQNLQKVEIGDDGCVQSDISAHEIASFRFLPE